MGRCWRSRLTSGTSTSCRSTAAVASHDFFTLSSPKPPTSCTPSHAGQGEAYGEVKAEHSRPDIVCFDPVDQELWVIDVTVA